MNESGAPGWHATTILMVRKGGRVVLGGDGQVSVGQTIMKGHARKLRRLAKGEVIAGFAGSTADALTLFERLESKLEQYPGQLPRACVVADIHMRGLTGIDLAKRVAAAADAPKVILVTGHPEESWRERALYSGAAGFLRKPIESKTLLDLVERSVAT